MENKGRMIVKAIEGVNNACLNLLMVQVTSYKKLLIPKFIDAHVTKKKLFVFMPLPPTLVSRLLWMKKVQQGMETHHGTILKG